MEKATKIAEIEGMPLWPSLFVRQSEIFLNFAPQPTLHLVISSMPSHPAPLPLLFCAADLHIVSLSHMQ